MGNDINPAWFIHTVPKNECLSHSVDRCTMALRGNEPMPIDISKNRPLAIGISL